ncbi:MAG TPA: alpha/beta fold hydrolase [Candidatus Limnocylindria bacterium]|nr:alpha/beta fold hydrolase [Candidatus Limnocylindria bacterium]
MVHYTHKRRYKFKRNPFIRIWGISKHISSSPPRGALADEGRQVIFYDQLGGGLSDRPRDDSLWTIPLFVEEVDRVRKHLGLQDIHLYGHSWGGMLAIEYLLTKPQGIRSVTLASSMIRMPLYQAEVDKLKQDLPNDVYATLAKHETAGTTDSDEYAKAVKEYEARHILRTRPGSFLLAESTFQM